VSGPGDDVPSHAASAAALRASLESAGRAYALVATGSMTPTLRPGDLVRVEPLWRLRAGDVVVYGRGGALVVHRVVSIAGTTVVCCGDGRRRHDPPVPLVDVLGVAVAAEGGRSLAGGRGVLLVARGRFWVAMLPRLALNVARDVELLWRQRRGRELPAPALSLAGPRDGRGGEGMALGLKDAWKLLAPSDVVSGRVPRDAEGGALLAAESVEVPAGIYSGLGPAERRRLLRALAGKRVVVWGFAAAGPRQRVVAEVRRLFARLGRPCGQPGDLAVLDGLGGWTVAHLFTAPELRAELASAGGRDADAGLLSTIDGAFVRATAQL